MPKISNQKKQSKKERNNAIERKNNIQQQPNVVFMHWAVRILPLSKTWIVKVIVVQFKVRRKIIHAADNSNFMHYQMVLVNACKVVIYLPALVSPIEPFRNIHDRTILFSIKKSIFLGQTICIQKKAIIAKKVRFYSTYFFGNVNKSENNSGFSWCTKPYKNEFYGFK